jgi:hypothetical protein
VTRFWDRPYRTVDQAVSEALLADITDPHVTRLPALIGSVEQWASTGMSQSDLGRALAPLLGRPWSRQAVSAAEKGARDFKIAELVAIARVLGTTVARGTYVKPWDGLVPEVIDSYLRNGADQWEANTRLSYANALQPAREWFAHRKARPVVREDVEDFKRYLLTSGRRRGGPPGSELGARSANLALGQLQAAFDLAERDGKVARNPVRFVKRSSRPSAIAPRGANSRCASSSPSRRSTGSMPAGCSTCSASAVRKCWA